MVSARVRKAAAYERAVAVAPMLRQLLDGAGGSVRVAATELNKRGVPSPTGGVWYAQQVRRAQQTLTAGAGRCVG